MDTQTKYPKEQVLELLEAVLELNSSLKKFMELFQDDYKETLNVSEVAKMVGCTTASIEQSKFIINKNPGDDRKKHLYMAGGKRQIPCYNIGKANYKYKRDDIVAFLAGRRYRYNEQDKTNKII